MTENQEIERLTEKAEPYLGVVNDLFKCEKNNPLESAIYGLTKKDPRSTILQCELILKQLLKELNSESKDELTQVQIDYILRSSHNFKSIDFETAVFTFYNLIQILERYHPDIDPKITTDNDLVYVREKLAPHQEYIDGLFIDGDPLSNAFEFSIRNSNKYKLCVAQTRLILEKLLPMIYFMTFGREPEKKGIADIISNKEFRLSHKQHHHTLDVIRKVGNWGPHDKDFPVNEKHALFSLHSIYILLKWFYKSSSTRFKEFISKIEEDVDLAEKYIEKDARMSFRKSAEILLHILREIFYHETNKDINEVTDTKNPSLQTIYSKVKNHIETNIDVLAYYIIKLNRELFNDSSYNISIECVPSVNLRK